MSEGRSEGTEEVWETNEGQHGVLPLVRLRHYCALLAKHGEPLVIQADAGDLSPGAHALHELLERRATEGNQVPR